jgi:hypothetical protein
VKIKGMLNRENQGSKIFTNKIVDFSTFYVIFFMLFNIVLIKNNKLMVRMFNKKVQKVFVIGDRKYTFAELKYNMEVHFMGGFSSH